MESMEKCVCVGRTVCRPRFDGSCGGFEARCGVEEEMSLTLLYFTT